MPLRSIVHIVLRMFALQWLFWSINTFFGEVIAYQQPGSTAVVFLIPAVIVFGAILIWFCAPVISYAVTPRTDSSLNLEGLSRYDLYCFAFVYLGLSTVLAAIAPALTETHQFISSGADEMKRQLFLTPTAYRLAGHVINIIAGSVAFLAASRWARLLLAADTDSSVGQS